MNLWIMAFMGGLVGALFMDIAETYMARAGINSGVKGAHIGRWVHRLLTAKFYHPDIEATTPVLHELRITAIFHYLVGGGVVALGYPVMLSFVNLTHFAWHLPYSMVFGLLTCILPWFVLMPAIGKGIFGNKMPVEDNPVIAPVLSHLVYGSGIGVSLIIYDGIMA